MIKYINNYKNHNYFVQYRLKIDISKVFTYNNVDLYSEINL